MGFQHMSFSVADLTLTIHQTRAEARSCEVCAEGEGKRKHFTLST